MDLIFLDTETTGVEDTDQIVQLAYVLVKDGVKYKRNRYYKPQVPISFKAMAVHHITNEKVAECPFLDENDDNMKTLNKLNIPDNVLIAHNADFDIGMLSNHGFNINMRKIDTLRCARHLLDDAQGHALGVIFYQYRLHLKLPELAAEMKIDLDGLAAHDALYDVLMLILVTRMLTRVAGGKVEKLIELTLTPVLIKEFTFGKHKGELVEDVAKTDAAYLNWMLKNMEDLGEDMRYTINKYLG